MDKENNSSQVENSKLETRLEANNSKANNSNSSNIKNSKLEPREPSSKVNLRRAAAVVVPPVVPPVNQGDLANVVKELEYLTSLGLTRNSDNEAMKTALRRYKELTRSEYAFPTTRPELSKVRKDLEYLTSLGLTRNSDNEAMKKALIEYHSLTGNEYEFPAPPPSGGPGQVVLPQVIREIIPTSIYYKDGALYYSDYFNKTIDRFDLNTGVVETIAGNGRPGYSGEEAGWTGSLRNPTGVVVDARGKVYIADTGNNRIRVLDASGHLITVAGDGTPGYSGDRTSWRGSVRYPTGLTISVEGNNRENTSLYIADTGNNRIRELDACGNLITVAGNADAAYSGEESGRRGSLNNPTGIAKGTQGRLYIADTGNNRIRVLEPSGNLRTIAGNGAQGYNGDGRAATSASLYSPQGVAVDTRGNIFIADSLNRRIRRVDTNGVITTVAGGVDSLYREGELATRTSIRFPSGVAVDDNGNIFIADRDANAIRRVDGNTGIIRTLIGPAPTGGRRRKMKKSRRVKRSRRVRKSRRINR